MSIRMLAKELYRLHREVERLTRALEKTPVEQQVAMSEKLRKATAQRENMRRVLAGRLGRNRP